MDKYTSMTELKNTAIGGKEWTIDMSDINSDTLITAIHGGGIEPGTSEVSRLISQIGHYNWFSFYGLKSSNNNDLHVTSTNYDEYNILSMLRGCYYTVSLHGCSGKDSVVYLGGNDVSLRETIKYYLIENGFRCEMAPQNISGEQKNNITNKNKRGKGVQLELSTTLRKSFFKDNDFKRKNREDKNQWSETMYHFADAIVKGLENYNEEQPQA